ncbi:MAG: hypothetical protein IBX50_13980 [Marinospirillum sp.]|uniref:hypothetical protein n=1 Tax=Marinospirillum sp. TaxID=2183934 RepID=UPI0019E60878|nr:hypothetical protein [Marinospirillum sp.]MBE0507796.1 hypothetical protein [Marinospirillum sp.]
MTKPRSWSELAQVHGLKDPHAKLRQVWHSLRYAEKRYLLQAAELPPETKLQDILSGQQAEKITAAIRRASGWAQGLGL